MLGNIITFLCVSWHSKIFISGAWLSSCQSIWIQIRSDRTSVLILVQTVCKGYQPTTIGAASKGKFNVTSPQTFLKKLREHIAFGMSVRPSIHHIYTVSRIAKKDTLRSTAAVKITLGWIMFEGISKKCNMCYGQWLRKILPQACGWAHRFS